MDFLYESFDEQIPIIENVEVFKTGTWRGKTYTLQDLHEMAHNFEKLRGILDPPLKVDHSESAFNISGWVTNVFVKDKSLFVDLEITEPDTLSKIKRGTFKKVSAEIYTSYTDESTLTHYGMVLRAVSIVSIPQLKNIKGIVLGGKN